MRNLKKLLAVIVSICVLATFTVPAFAADTAAISADATICKDLGVLQGDGSGVTAEYLAKGTTRLQSAILYLRLMGKEAEALAFTGTETFADADKVDWAGGKAILGYLKANPTLGWIGDGTNFDPNSVATAQELYKVMLTALGYVQGTDFEYANVITFADGKGLKLKAADTSISNDDTATILVEALKANVKDGSKTLAADLVAKNIITEAAAQAAGLLKATATAKASGAKKFEVTFSKAVDTAVATFAVKKGSITMAVSKVAWNDAKTVATITMVSSLVDGDYVITVGGLDLAVTAYTVTATASKVASIEITSDVAAKTADPATDVTFGYVVKNQYGEDVTSSATLTWTASSGSFLPADPDTGIKQLSFTSAAVKDAVFVVTAIDPATGVYATKTIKVGDVAKVAKINVLGLYNEDGDTLYTNSTYSDFAVKVEAFDQYGNEVGIAALNDATQTTVVVSNPASIINKGAFAVVDDVTALVLADPTGTKTAGTATINFISNITGQSSSIAITVTKAAALDALTLSAPADIVVKGESIEIPFSAVDQYGVELSEKSKGDLVIDGLTPDLTLTCTDPAATLDFAYNYETKKAELTLDLTNAAVTTGSKIIMAVTKTGKVSQITVNVKDTAIPSTVTSVDSSVATKLTVDATSTLKESKVVVIDQYGRTMTLNATWFGKYKLAFATATPTKVTLNALEITADGNSVNLVGVAAGTSTISVSVKKIDNTAIANSTYEFTAETVAKSVITEYVVEAPEKLYNNVTHAKDFSVYGKTASGAKVALTAADYIATSNLTGFHFSASAIDAGGVVIDDEDTDVTATLLVIIAGADGPQSITKSIIVTNKAPVLTTLTVDATVYYDLSDLDTIASVVAAEFEGDDQYAVDKAPVITNILITNLSTTNDVTVSDNGTATAAFAGEALVAGDSFQATIITNNGLSKSTSVVVVP